MAMLNLCSHFIFKLMICYDLLFAYLYLGSNIIINTCAWYSQFATYDSLRPSCLRILDYLLTSLITTRQDKPIHLATMWSKLVLTIALQKINLLQARYWNRITEQCICLIHTYFAIVFGNAVYRFCSSNVYDMA